MEILVLILAVIFCIGAFFLSEKKTLVKYNKIFCFLTVLFSVLGAVFYILNVNECRISGRGYNWSVLDNMFDPFSFVAGFFLDAGLILLLIYLAVRSRIKGIENAEREAEEERMEQLRIREEFEQKLKDDTWEFPVDEFIENCEKHGIFQVCTEADYQRAKLIALDILVEKEVHSEYHNRYTSHEAIKNYIECLSKKKKEEEDKLLCEKKQQMLNEEAELERIYTTYAECTGREKLIRICQDKIEEANEIIYQCERDEESVRNGGEATYMLGRQKESSWAIHGGVASGIAGGAAGLAVATDVERRNQEKRQQNKQLLHSIAELSVMQLERIWKRKRSAESDLACWSARLEEAKVLLSEKMDQNDLLAMLHPSVENYEIAETGAVKLKVKLYSTPNLIIFDEVKAVVDGSIKVLLKMNNEVVGSAICVLPFGGMDGSTTVNAICCEPEKKATAYTFDFVPNHLWAVETKADVFDSWGYEQEKKKKEAAEEEAYKRKLEELIRKVSDTVSGKCAATPDTIEYMEVLNAMKGQGALTVPQILDKMPDPDKLTNQKLSALLRVLAEANIIEQTEVKCRSFWEYK